MLFKVIHWEAHIPKNNNGEAIPTNDFLAKPLRHTQTEKIGGLLLRWTLRLTSIEGQHLLSYIGESNYFFQSSPDIAAIRWCVYSSHNDYLNEYARRVQPIGLAYRIPLLKDGEINFQKILDDLHE